MTSFLRPVLDLHLPLVKTILSSQQSTSSPQPGLAILSLDISWPICHRLGSSTISGQTANNRNHAPHTKSRKGIEYQFLVSRAETASEHLRPYKVPCVTLHRLKCDRERPCQGCKNRADESSCLYGSQAIASKADTISRGDMARHRLSQLEKIVLSISEKNCMSEPVYLTVSPRPRDILSSGKFSRTTGA